MGHERPRGSKPHVHACPLRAKSGGSVIVIRSVTKCQQQALGYSISLALPGPQAPRSALDPDLSRNPSSLSVQAQDRELALGHVLRKQGLAITAPDYTLIPFSNPGFGDFSEVRSIHAEDDNEAVVVVEGVAWRAGRAVLRGDGDIVSVVRERQILDDLTNI